MIYYGRIFAEAISVQSFDGIICESVVTCAAYNICLHAYISSQTSTLVNSTYTHHPIPLQMEIVRVLNQRRTEFLVNVNPCLGLNLLL